MNLRMIGLTAVVVLTALVPLAASAGPPADDSKPGAEAHDKPEPERGLLAGIGASDESDEFDEPGASDASGGSGVWHGTGRTPARTAARCGPELASPDGVEAQTCVLTEGRDTWARTYYRNATGRELNSVLTLMGPGGRTVQTHCVVEAGDEPGACETPREPSRGPAYSAVAEFVAADEEGEGPLLLRSGSNSHEPGGR
jgi:hypothetical protein